MAAKNLSQAQEADDLTLKALGKFRNFGVTVIGHCYSGGQLSLGLVYNEPMSGRTVLGQNYDTAPARILLEKHASLQYPYTCTFGKATLRLDRGVFCPTLTNVSPLLLKTVDFRSGERVLDAFAGSGAFGINAALHNGKVVAFDTSALAIGCIQDNALRNGVNERVEARLGSVTEILLPDERFDLVIANPPLLPGTPDQGIEAALFDKGLQATKDFIANLPKLLAPKDDVI